jgi:hypothetical protein
MVYRIAFAKLHWSTAVQNYNNKLPFFLRCRQEIIAFCLSFFRVFSWCRRAKAIRQKGKIMIADEEGNKKTY